MKEFNEKLKNTGLIPVIKIDRVSDAVPLAGALIAGGLAAAEITLRTPAAADAIKAIADARKDGLLGSFLLGAGTVLNAADARMAVENGADFIVSPGFDRETVEYCLGAGVPVIPGVSTPTELMEAVSLGLDTVKFFPAEASGGVAALKAMSAPFPQISFMPTGGVSGKNLKKYLSLPCVLCCGGSFMVPGDALKSGDFGKIEELTRSAVKLLKGEEEAAQAPAAVKCDISAEGTVAGFGEFMMRLSPPDRGVLRTAASLDVNFGGSEANTLTLLSVLGQKTEFISALPVNPIGQAAVDVLRRFGVGVNGIKRTDGRMGVYYVEKGAGERSSSVLYDRKDSVFALSGPDDYDWNALLDGVTWFHFSGITPALSAGTRTAMIEAAKAAKAKGIALSCDINYRRTLWTVEEAAPVMRELTYGLTLCLANEDAAELLGVEMPQTDDRTLRCEIASRAIAEKYGCRYVAMTLRSSHSADDNDLRGTLYCADTDKFYISPLHKMHIVDRIGGGDAFGGGLIYALRAGFDPQKTVDFAAAACSLKHSVDGDFPIIDMRDIMALTEAGDGTVRVRR